MYAAGSTRLFSVRQQNRQQNVWYGDADACCQRAIRWSGCTLGASRRSRSSFAFHTPTQLRDGTVLVTFTDDSLPAALSTRIGLLPGRPLITEGAEHRVGRMFVSYRFSQSDVPMKTNLDESMRHAITRLLEAEWTDALNLDQGDGIARQTIVEATTLIIGESNEGAVRGALRRSVESLDRIIRSYQISLGSTIAPVKQEQLPAFIPYIVGPLDDSGTWIPELHRIATEPRFHSPPLGEDADLPTLEQLQVGLTRLMRGDPILQVWDRFHHTRRLLFEGYAGDAVIHAQTGIELFSDSVGLLLLWEQNMTPEAAVARFDWNFPKRLERISAVPRWYVGCQHRRTSSRLVYQAVQASQSNRSQIA